MTLRRPTVRPPLKLVPAAGTSAPERDRTRRNWTVLMARAQDGDQSAYRTLLEGMTPFLRALAARRFKNAADIDDAVQDVLLTVHAVRHAYDPSRPFGPWLVAIAIRRIIDRLRRQMRNHSHQEEFLTGHETFVPDPANLGSGFDEMSGDEATLLAAVEKLPPDQRQAIRLLKLKEMSLKETALATGRTVSALKVATHRAIKSLRKILLQSGKTP